MAQNEQSKILRLGIIHNNRIIEERLFRKPGPITIGQSPKNSFVYPLPGFPRSYELFKCSKQQYTLTFPGGLDGKVSSTDDIFELSELVEQKKARKSGEFYLYDLTENSRGKIILGELTLLFQFVTPPPPVPKLKLPASARGGWLQQLDVALFLFLLGSLVIQGGSIVSLNVWWESRGKYLVSTVKKKRLFETLKAEVQTRRNDTQKPLPKEDTKIDEKAKPEAKVAPVKEAPKKKEKAKKKAKKKAEGKVAEAKKKGDAGKDKKARYKKQVENVKKNTLIKFLVAEGGDGEGDSMYQNTLKDGVNTGKMGDAWNMKGGIQVAQEGDVGQYVGKPKAGAGGGGYAKAGKKYQKKKLAVGKVDAGSKKAKKEVKLKVKIGGSLGNKLGTGNIDKQSVSAVFRRRAGAIRHCYEKRLKVVSELSGKLRVMFTIGPAGRITNIVIQSNTTGDSALASCITSRIKEWPFPRPKGGAVTFVRTIVLTKG